MHSGAFGIYGKQVVTPDGIREAVILINGGTIAGLVEPSAVPDGMPLENAGHAIVMPGLVDSHVHVNEPGRTEWEGFETATRAAAAGGITTIADMPLNSNPVTTTLDAFKIKQRSTANKLFVDCAFYGGVVPGNAASLEAMIDAGVVGFKCFLTHSGIDDFPNVVESDLLAAMPILAKRGIPLLVHAELEHDHDREAAAKAWTDERSYKSFLESRPRRWEDDAIRLMIRLCDQLNCKVHIVHLSSADLMPEINQATQRLPFTVETCPHYLTFAAEEIPDGDTRFKCAPPIRERENREKLWAGLKDQTIKIVVSDHSPCVPDLKFIDQGDLKKAWGGVSSLQFRLPAVWTEASKRGFTLENLTDWLCVQPANFLGLGDRKGKLAKGYDADVVIWDSAALTSFNADNIHHKNKETPYEGRELRGLVRKTYLRGRKIYDNGKITIPASGQQLLRLPAGAR
jgi:allantoinase